jgi:hypothetical protein
VVGDLLPAATVLTKELTELRVKVNLKGVTSAAPVLSDVTLRPAVFLIDHQER